MLSMYGVQGAACHWAPLGHCEHSKQSVAPVMLLKVLPSAQNEHSGERLVEVCVPAAQADCELLPVGA